MDYLGRLLQWWRVELDDTRASELEERNKRPWSERLREGHALTALTFARREQKRSGVLHWFRREDRDALPKGVVATKACSPPSEVASSLFTLFVLGIFLSVLAGLFCGLLVSWGTPPLLAAVLGALGAVAFVVLAEQGK